MRRIPRRRSRGRDRAALPFPSRARPLEPTSELDEVLGRPRLVGPGLVCEAHLVEVVLDFHEPLRDKLAKRPEAKRVERDPHGALRAVHHAGQRDLVVADGHRGGHPVRAQKLGHLFADRRRLRIRDDGGGVSQIGEAELGSPSQLVVAMHDRHEPLGEDGNEGEVGFVVDLGAENDLVSVAFEVLDQRKRESLAHVHGRALSVLGPVGADERGEVIALDGVDGAHVHVPRGRASVLLREGDAAFEGVDRFERVLVELLAVAREPHMAPFAFEEGYSQLPFQRGDGV